jgi:hypothetical protein
MLRQPFGGDALMTERITKNDLQKAARNLERLAVFVGERRSWILGQGCEGPAMATRETAQSLADLLSGWSDDLDGEAAGILKPAQLEPVGKISAGRMTKFSEFLDQLFGWFESHQDADLPEDSEVTVAAIRISLTTTAEALTELLGPAAAFAATQPIDVADATSGDEVPEEAFGPLTSPDLGPVAEVDMRARLVLEDTPLTPLLQEFRGVVELTKEAKEQVQEFFAKQGVTVEGQALRRLNDKVLKWVEGTPEGRVLVIKISGLSGTPQPYSSYQSKESVNPGDSADD